MVTKTFLWVVCVISVCTGCQQTESKPMALNCVILLMDPDSLSRAAFCVLNDIETFFFIDFASGTKFSPVRFLSDESIRLFDTTGLNSPERWLAVSGTVLDDKWRLNISAPAESRLRLDSDLTIDIPSNGSTIIRTSNPLKDNEQTYVWVIAADPN